ncbi:hypothetical protein F4604DRAFT_1932565 [Suillus subluteus]|nr:hypothetical protein F4604DRAFT_1932565 [Suillus subluteus]
MPMELPVSLKLVIEVTFSMFSLVLHNPTWTGSSFARSIPNPYLSVKLTVLAAVTKHARETIQNPPEHLQYTPLVPLTSDLPEPYLDSHDLAEHGYGTREPRRNDLRGPLRSHSDSQASVILVNDPKAKPL